MAKLRGLRFEVDLRLLDGALVAFLLPLRLALAQQPQQMLLLFTVGLQSASFDAVLLRTLAGAASGSFATAGLAEPT